MFPNYSNLYSREQSLGPQTNPRCTTYSNLEKAIRTAILIPARDESKTLPRLFTELERVTDTIDCILVVDNASRDITSEVAKNLGALVVYESRPGYGHACMAGIDRLRREFSPEVLIFLDADDFAAPKQLNSLLDPIREGKADLVVGERRTCGEGGVRWHARLGNQFITAALRIKFGSHVRDMGPFRAIRWSMLEALELDDPTYGWYVQMQVRALRSGYRVHGIEVDFERRTAGRSKVSGNLIASVRAGWVMLRTLVVESLRAKTTLSKR